MLASASHHTRQGFATTIAAVFLQLKLLANSGISWSTVLARYSSGACGSVWAWVRNCSAGLRAPLLRVGNPEALVRRVAVRLCRHVHVCDLGLVQPGQPRQHNRPGRPGFRQRQLAVQVNTGTASMASYCFTMHSRDR